MRLKIFTTGGTIDKVYFDAKDTYEVGDPQIGEVLTRVNVSFSYEVETLFTGQVASAQGFVQPARTAVTIEIGCEAAWCGAVPEGEVVALIERREDRFVLEQGPCPRFALTATDDVVNAALACARGEACEAPE